MIYLHPNTSSEYNLYIQRRVGLFEPLDCIAWNLKGFEISLAWKSCKMHSWGVGVADGERVNI